MHTQLKPDRPQHHRFLLDCRPRDVVTIRNPTPLPNIAEAIEFVTATPLCSRIDLTDGYYNIRMDSHLGTHTTCLCYMRHCRCGIMQQGDCNAPAPMVRAMHEIFIDLMCQDLIIYIYDIIISGRNYKQHVEALRKVLQCLQDQQFWLQQSKCQFLTKRFNML